MYEPDAVIIWNGREVARGESAVRKFHEAFFDPSIKDVKLDKKMICASKDTIAGSVARELGQSRWFPRRADRG